MKTYEIQRDYHDPFRLTVADDVDVTPGSHGNSISALFRTVDEEGYPDKVLASYANINYIKLIDDSVVIQEQQYVEDEEKQAACQEACKDTGSWEWVDVSKK